MSLMLALVMCVGLGCVSTAYAATVESNYNAELVANDAMRSAEWPDTAWDIASKGAYEGSITRIFIGYGVFTNYYFTCNSDGKLKVTAKLTASYITPKVSKCIIEIYDRTTKKLVDTYDPGFEAYNETYISHTFINLKPSTPYVVRFYNASETTDYENNIFGDIKVLYP